MNRIRGVGAAVIAVATLMFVLWPGEAGARGEPGGGRETFRCRLAVTRDSGDLVITYRLRSSVAHETWRVKILDNDHRVWAGDRTTNADGRLHVTKRTPNRPGRDHLLGRARNLKTDGVCPVTLTVK